MKFGLSCDLFDENDRFDEIVLINVDELSELPLFAFLDMFTQLMNRPEVQLYVA